MKTAEQRVAEAALEEPSVVLIGGKSFSVRPPSLATLMKVSAHVSQLPAVDSDVKDSIGETLRVAKDFGLLSDIITTLILGAKSKFPVLNSILSAPYRIKYAFVRWFVENKAQPKELHDALVEIAVNRMQTGFFLAVGHSLSAINTTKPTKMSTTAPGQ